MKITVQKITYHYPRKKEAIFKEFSFSAEKGITLLKGFSGCGKSTLLKLIAGYLKPQKGLIATSSKYKVGSNKFLTKEVGFVFQQMNLLPLASLKRNITLSSLRQSKTEVQEWLERFGLKDLAAKKPSQLSGGQIQRGAIARAMAKKPSLLLLDEPTSGLDDLNTKVICNALTSYLNTGAICLIATHDSRLDSVANQILDFNINLPAEEHLKALQEPPDLESKKRTK